MIKYGIVKVLFLFFGMGQSALLNEEFKSNCSALIDPIKGVYHASRVPEVLGN